MGALRGTGFLFFLSSISEERSFMASPAMTGIYWPTVLVGITASSEMGELSKPTRQKSSGNLPYFRINIFKRTLAWVSLGMKMPFFLWGYFTTS